MARTVEEVLEWGRKALLSSPLRIPRREADLLLSRVLGRDEAWVVSRGDAAVSPAEAERYESWVRRRLGGEPVAYLFGEREFFGRTFFVDSRVLIPRPETEHLIESALRIGLPPSPRVLDLGTGSGCIAVTIACEISEVRVVAVDLSIAALAVARANARRHGVPDRVRFVSADLATGLDPSSFDLVLCNPPYVDPGEEALLSCEVTRFEPRRAVFAPVSGLSIIERVLLELWALESGRHLILEIGSAQEKRVRELLPESPFELVEIRSDLAGLPRVALVRRR